ncbi:MAG: AzlD domain-containing protein [Anaerolineales bacterium]|nr:AzlD domain-containing protein [Anaerolineales bacterium]
MKPFMVIIGMMLVTYTPRLLPGLLMERFNPPAWFEKWLKNIPYAALGALIVPGIFDGETRLIGLVSGVVAVILSLLNLHIVLVMVGAVLAAYGVQVLL